MYGKVKKVFWLCVAVLSLTLPGCRPEGIIPKDDMVTVLSEFYEADAMIEAANTDAGAVGRSVDSLRVYQPVLDKYGYSREEFRNSLVYYLHRPAELQSIFKRTRARLEAKVSEMERAENRPSEIEGADVEDHDEAVEEEMAAREQAGLEALDEGPAAEKKAAPRRSVKKKLSKKELRQLEQELK